MSEIFSKAEYVLGITAITAKYKITGGTPPGSSGSFFYSASSSMNFYKLKVEIELQRGILKV